MATGRIDLTPMAPNDPLSDSSSLSQRWKTCDRQQTKASSLVVSSCPSHAKIFLTPWQKRLMTTTTILLLQLTYFSPKKHVGYEIFKFRGAKHQADETIDHFTTRLRKLAATCDFTSIDKEVKSAIIQNYSSKRLRRYALLFNELTLAKLLAKGRAFEPSESQATGIEKSLKSTSISEEIVEAVGPSNRVPGQIQASRTRQDSVTQPQCRKENRI